MRVDDTEMPEMTLCHMPDVAELTEGLWAPDGSVVIRFLYLVATLASREYADDLVADLCELIEMRDKAGLPRDSTASLVLGELLAFQNPAAREPTERGPAATGDGVAEISWRAVAEWRAADLWSDRAMETGAYGTGAKSQYRLVGHSRGASVTVHQDAISKLAARIHTLQERCFGGEKDSEPIVVVNEGSGVRDTSHIEGWLEGRVRTKGELTADARTPSVYVTRQVYDRLQRGAAGETLTGLRALWKAKERSISPQARQITFEMSPDDRENGWLVAADEWAQDWKSLTPADATVYYYCVNCSPSISYRLEPAIVRTSGSIDARTRSRMSREAGRWFAESPGEHSDEAQAVLLARFFEGMTTAQVAAALGMTESRAHRLYKMALMVLKRELRHSAR